MTNRVFIVELPRTSLDVSTAKQFGDITYVFETSMRRCSVFKHDEFGNSVLEQLSAMNFDPISDYICAVGAMLPVMIALVAIAQTYDEFNVLLFNSVNGAYVNKRFNKGDWVIERTQS